MKRILTLAGVLCVSIVPAILAANPSWWTDSGTAIIDSEASHDASENYAPANLGQLKNVAAKAKLHLDNYLPQKAGSQIDDLINSFEPRSEQGYTQAQIDAFIADNYAPINLGQLKAVAKLFYDRLQDFDYDTEANLITHGYPANQIFNGYPWNPATPKGDNYAPANLGQLKMVFSFDLSAPTGQLPSWWVAHFFPDQSGILPGDDSDGDGLTNLQEFQQQSDPTNYYSQGGTTITPTLTIIEGDTQAGVAGQYLPRALKVEVRNSADNGLMVGTPVVFSTGGDGGFSTAAGSPSVAADLTATTDSSGVASAFLRTGSASVTNVISAKASSATVNFRVAAMEGGLVGHWRFDEGTGFAISDSCPLGINGLLGAQGPAFQDGMVGKALSFGGIGQDAAYSDIISNIDFLSFGDRSFSVSFWFKSDSTGHNRLFGYGAWYNVKGYAIELTQNINGDPGHLVLGVSSKDGFGPSSTYPEALGLTTIATFNDSQWHHVAAVIDREAGKANVYVDGVSQEFDPASSTGTGLVLTPGTAGADISAMTNLDAASDDRLGFGQFQSVGNPYRGLLDEVRIYAKSLSAAEVLALKESEGPLTAKAGQLTIDEDTLGTFTLQSQGGGETPATYEIVTAPANGTAELSGGVVSYYPNGHFNGTDLIRFRVAKGGRTSEADITVTVMPQDDPPLVSVGGAQSVTLPSGLTINAVVTDIDTLPANIRLSWVKVDGPGDVTFTEPSLATTTATFSVEGQYKLRLSANDGHSTRSDSLIVTVNPGGVSDLPVITLFAPVDNAAKTLGQPFTIQASATAPTGQTVSKVEFYEGSKKIGEALAPDSTSGLYVASWTPPRIGAYALSAVATTNTGLKNASGMRQILVTDGGWFGGSGVQFGNEGYAGSGGTGGIGAGTATGPGSSQGPGTGGAGGGGSSGGGGDGFGNDKDADTSAIDTDDDGLTDAEEDEIGTNKAEADTDGDGTPDNLDGWAGGTDPEVEKLLAPPRLPKVQYAVVDLGENFDARDVNNQGQVLLRAKVGGRSYFWDGELTALPEDVGAVGMNNHGVATGTTAGVLTVDGSVVSELPSSFYDEAAWEDGHIASYSNKAFTWTKAQGKVDIADSDLFPAITEQTGVHGGMTSIINRKYIYVWGISDSGVIAAYDAEYSYRHPKGETPGDIFSDTAIRYREEMSERGRLLGASNQTLGSLYHSKYYDDDLSDNSSGDAPPFYQPYHISASGAVLLFVSYEEQIYWWGPDFGYYYNTGVSLYDGSFKVLSKVLDPEVPPEDSGYSINSDNQISSVLATGGCAFRLKDDGYSIRKTSLQYPVWGINKRMQGVTSDDLGNVCLWENYRARPFSELVDPEKWEVTTVAKISDNGFIIASAKLLRDPQGEPIPPGLQKSHALLLMPIEFVTKGKDGKPAGVDGFFNGTSAPVIEANVVGCSISSSNVVTVAASGTVTDASSDLVESQGKQLQSITISAPGAANTINLSNSGSPILPWQPYHFASNFSASVSFAVPGPGEYMVNLSTSQNAGGLAGSTQAYVGVSDEIATVEVTADFNAGSPDVIRYYDSANSSGSASELFTETESGSLIFVRDPEDTFRIEINSPGPLTTNIDTLSIRIQYNQLQYRDVFLTETGPNTKVFRRVDRIARCSPFPKTESGTFLPIMVRFPAAAMLEGSDIRISAMGEDWKLAKKDFGGGEYLYAVDSQQKAVIFNPERFAHTAPQTNNVVGDEWRFGILKAGSELGFAELENLSGLLIGEQWDSELEFHLGSIDKEYRQLGEKRYRYYYPKKDAQGNLLSVSRNGRPNAAIREEILWRYVSTPNKVILFDAKRQLEDDIKYREQVVDSVNYAYFGFPDSQGAATFNSAVWVTAPSRTFSQVRSSQTAATGISDLFSPKNPVQYRIPCADSAMALQARAVLMLLGAAKFNSASGATPFALLRSVQSRSTLDEWDWIPGDTGVVINTSQPSNPNNLNNGENITYLGGCYAMDGTFRGSARFWGNWPYDPIVVGAGDLRIKELSWFLTQAFPSSVLSFSRDAVSQSALRGISPQ